MFKNFIQKSVFAILFSSLFFSSVYAAQDYHIENQPKVLERVVQFEQKGILKQKDNGYLYLEVSNDFVGAVLPLLEYKGRIVPPRHYSSKKGIGAHISVMYENEQILNEIWEIKELGREYTFTIKELRTVKINRDNKMKKLWLIAVSAPELEELRESYGLSSKLKGHDFHITIGSQVPGAEALKVDKIAHEKLVEYKQAA